MLVVRPLSLRGIRCARFGVGNIQGGCQDHDRERNNISAAWADTSEGWAGCIRKVVLEHANSSPLHLLTQIATLHGRVTTSP